MLRALGYRLPSAHGALRRYDPAQPMGAWLARIAIDKCREWDCRRAVRRAFRFMVPIENVADDYADETPGQDVETADRHELAHMRRAIADLPASQREPLILHAVEGHSYRHPAGSMPLGRSMFRKPAAGFLDIVHTKQGRPDSASPVRGTTIDERTHYPVTTKRRQVSRRCPRRLFARRTLRRPRRYTADRQAIAGALPGSA